jgi:hypothetical protein
MPDADSRVSATTGGEPPHKCRSLPQRYLSPRCWGRSSTFIPSSTEQTEIEGLKRDGWTDEDTCNANFHPSAAFALRGCSTVSCTESNPCS